MDKIEINRQLDKLKKQQEDDWERYKALLPETEDIELIVLKGHLIIEEMLFKLTSDLCNNPKYLESARLSFKQLIFVARSLIFFEFAMEKGWEAISVLNSFRNKLSHNLEPKNVDQYIETLVGLCKSDKEYPENYKPPEKPTDKTKAAICYIIGQLNVIAIFSKFLKDNQKLN